MNESLPEPLSFEESLVELERTVRELEDGRLGLEESLGRYERGVSLIRRCQAQLQKHEQRIFQLTGMEEGGQPILQPFKHEATGSTRGDLRRLPRNGADAD